MNQLVQRDEPRSLIPISAEALIQDAITHGVPIETMERLLLMRQELRREQSAAAFFEAMAEFQASIPAIPKTKTAKAGQYSYSYADLASIQQAIAPRLHACGLSIGFETQQDGDTLNVVCIVRHAGGHSERTSFPAPVDRQARMNDTQKVGSALTYGRRYALTAALGIVTADEDDDGQASGYQAPSKPPRRPQEPSRTQEAPPPSPAPGRVTEPQIRRLHARIRELGLDRERVKSWVLRSWKIDSFNDLTKDQYKTLDERLEPWATESLHQRDALAARVLDYAKRKGWSGDLAELPALAAKVREQAASVGKLPNVHPAPPTPQTWRRPATWPAWPTTSRPITRPKAMPISSRNKGAAGERELARLLADELGITMVRNLAQSRSGGSDLIGLPAWSIEVKRAKAVTAGLIHEWWSQAEAQAIREGKRPALAYRADRQPWRVALRLGDLIPALPHWQGPDWLAHVSIPAFAAINREETL